MSIYAAEEPDLDYDDEPVDPNAETTELERDFRRRTEARGSGRDWATYMRAYRERMAARPKIEAGGGILRWVRAEEPLPPAAARLRTRLEAARFVVRVDCTRVTIAPLRFVGETEGHSAGDERTPGHEQVHWSVQARLRHHEQAVAALWANWSRAEIPGRKPGNKFVSATSADVLLGLEFHRTVGEFEDWLGAFAPPPPKPARKVTAS